VGVFGDVGGVIEINEIVLQDGQVNHEGKQDQEQNNQARAGHGPSLLSVTGWEAKIIFHQNYIAFLAAQGSSFTAGNSDPPAAWRPVPHHQVTKICRP
jgi:hypothetical protein